MKSIKTMLLGIAILIIASCGVPMWLTGSAVGAVMFGAGLIVGINVCLMGFFSKNQ